MKKNDNDKIYLPFNQGTIELRHENGTVFHVAVYEDDTPEEIKDRCDSANALCKTIVEMAGALTPGVAQILYYAFSEQVGEEFYDFLKNKAKGWFVGATTEDKSEEIPMFLRPDDFLKSLEEFDKLDAEEGNDE